MELEREECLISKRESMQSNPLSAECEPPSWAIKLREKQRYAYQTIIGAANVDFLLNVAHLDQRALLCGMYEGYRILEEFHLAYSRS
jgi:hypothetical protein